VSGAPQLLEVSRSRHAIERRSFAQPSLFVNERPDMTRHVRNPAVLFQPVADGAVLLHTEREMYFGLNQVGARIWELLSIESGADALCEALAQRYPNVSGAALRADIDELLDHLLAEGLLTAAAAA
jgi:hypothetical protein